MITDGRVKGLPLVNYSGVKATIEALTLTAADAGALAYATDTAELGVFDGAAWAWGALADYLTAAEHTAIGNSAPHHAAVTLDVNADTLLSLSTQALGLDTQTARYALMGPTSGVPAVPAFRSPQAADVVVPNGLGTPTYDDMQDYLNLAQAGGRLTGGDLTAHAPADGTLDISEMEGMIHTANTRGSPLIYFKKAAVASIALTDLAVNYILITYSAPLGVPTLTYSTSAARPPVDTYNSFVVGRCWRSGTSVEPLTTGQNIYDMYGRQQDRLLTKYGSMDRATGSVVGAHATPLRLTCNIGTWYFGNTPLTTAAADTFHVWYKTGGGAWTESAALTLFSEVFDGGANTVYTTYQNGTSLGALGGSKYGVYWIFQCPEGDLYVVLGTATYANIGSAQAAAVPASLPPYCVNWARLIGRVICQNAAAAFYSVESVFATTFTLSAATDHASLVNLPWTSAAHTSTPNSIAAFNGAGVAIVGMLVAPTTNVLTLTATAASTLATAITAGKTLTLTATDNYNFTIPATGTAVIGGGAGAANRVAYWSDANTLASDAGLTVDAANDLYIVANAGGIGNAVATARLIFDSSGATDYAALLGCYVGVGTAAPQEVLHVYGATGVVRAEIESGDGGAAALKLTNTEGSYFVYTDAGVLIFYDVTASLARGRWSADGNLLIGTTTDGMTAAGSLAIAKDLAHRGTYAGFYNTTPITKPTVSGARNNPEAALADLLTELANLGLITNSTTAS